MPLVAYLSDLGASQLNAKRNVLVEANSLPNVEQWLESFVDDHICIVSLTRSPREKIHVSEQYVVAVEGDVINVSGLPELLKRFQRDGTSFVESLNGNFNIVIYDRSKHDVTVVNCKASLHNFFYQQIENECVFSSNIRSIVRSSSASPSLNSLSLYKFLSFNYVFGDETMVSGIKRLPLGSVANASRQSVGVTAYWKPVFGDFIDKNPDGIAEEFNEKMIEATKLRFDYYKDITIFLSGGRDSRLIAAAAERAGVQAETVTYGIPGSADLEYGGEMAKRLGFPNHQYARSGGHYKYSDHLSLLVWLNEAHSPIKPITSTQLHPFLIEKGVFNYSHGSTFGLLSSGFIPPYAFYPLTVENKIGIALGRLGCWQRNPEFLTQSFEHAHRGQMTSEFYDSFRNTPGKCFADRFLSWYYFHRESRLSFNTGGVNGYYFNGIHFFLDSNLLDFYFRVPLRARFEQLYQKKACITINPKIADVPNQETGRRMSGSLMVGFFDRVNEKLLRGTRWRKRVSHKDSRKDVAEDPELRTYLLDKANSNDFLPGVFNSDAIESMVNEHYSGSRDHTMKLLNVAALARFEDMYLKDRCAHFPEDAAKILHGIPYAKLSDEGRETRAVV